jgi:hypothetical protein
MDPQTPLGSSLMRRRAIARSRHHSLSGTGTFTSGVGPKGATDGFLKSLIDLEAKRGNEGE